jgi:hypothetical protein
MQLSVFAIMPRGVIRTLRAARTRARTGSTGSWVPRSSIVLRGFSAPCALRATRTCARTGNTGSWVPRSSIVLRVVSAPCIRYALVLSSPPDEKFI